MRRPKPRAKPSGIVTATVLAGEILSDVIDCTVGAVQLIIMPDQWDDANLSFQASGDGITFYDWHTRDGGEMIVPCKAGTAFVPEFIAVKNMWIKIRSGHSGDPVPQSADRTFTIVMV